MGVWNDAARRIKEGHPPPRWERNVLVPPAELQKAMSPLPPGVSTDYTLARNEREARHLPLMHHTPAGGRGPHKMVGATYEILRAFVRQSPWVGAAVNIRQREVGASKWRIVPALEGHKEELDHLRQLIMGARRFDDLDYLVDQFRPSYLPKKMVKQLTEATLKPDGISPSDVRYRFRLAYLELLTEAQRHTKKARTLLEKPNNSGDADSWSEILKGIIPDLLILDCGVLDLRRSDSPTDEYGHTLPNNPILEVHWVDGATIRPCLDDHGALRVPSKEDQDAAAYEQWIDNQRVASFQRHNLVRFIENPQTDIIFRGYGFSRVEYLLMTMILESHADKSTLEEFKRAFYGGFLNVKDPSMMMEDVESFRHYIEEQLEGNRKIPILSFKEGVEWISAQMKEMSSNNSVEQRKHHIERVSATFEMPMVKLGIGDTSNYSTAEVSQDAGDDGLLHLLDVVDKGITRWIVRDPGFGSYEYLRYESRPAHEREDAEELDLLQKELEMGIRLPNEVRMERGDGPIDAGDQPFSYFTEYHKAKGMSDGQAAGAGASMGMEDGMEGEEEEDGGFGDGAQKEGQEAQTQYFGDNNPDNTDNTGNPDNGNIKEPGQDSTGAEGAAQKGSAELEKALDPLREALLSHLSHRGTIPQIEVEIEA